MAYGLTLALKEIFVDFEQASIKAFKLSYFQKYMWARLEKSIYVKMYVLKVGLERL